MIRFWGNEIKNNVEGCVDEIKDVIFQSELDAFYARLDNGNCEFTEMDK